MQLSALKKELAHPRTSLQVCILGVLGGCVAALVIIAFRLSIEWLHDNLLAAVATYVHASWGYTILPVVTGLFIIIASLLIGRKYYRLGIPYVIHRIKYHYGVIPLRATLHQFFGGMFALAGGFVVGREGPSVHLGAASSSWLGEKLHLPYNSIRILAGCGIAAGISASFNTPLAAVIFVMEVVMRDYKIHIFVPIMLAAACGSVLTRMVFGEVNELAFLPFTALNYSMYLYLIVFGICLGGLAALFNRQIMWLMQWGKNISFGRRILLAALVTSIVSALLPQAMGAYIVDVEALFSSNPSVLLISGILVAKFALAVVAIGLGVPGGIIGAVLVIGLIAGALLLQPAFLFYDIQNYTTSFALLGAAGMLTAVLHSPLAALSAVMELSYSPEIVLPAILVVVPAYVTATRLFKTRSIFIEQLEYHGLDYAVSSIQESLERTGVLAAIDTQFTCLDNANERQLERHLNEHNTALINRTLVDNDTQLWLVRYDLSLQIHAAILTQDKLVGISDQATLFEVYDVLRKQRSGAVYIYTRDVSKGDVDTGNVDTSDLPDSEEHKMIGLITWEQLQRFLQKAQF